MSEKFSYSPGRPGFGQKGSDGSAGSQGLSLYFTDYDPATQSADINIAIINNYVLWSISPRLTLPAGRVYVTGDLFIDSDGKAYEINAETNTYEYKFSNLNTAGYFISADVSSSVYGFNRYFNSNTSPKYVIDNVYANGAVAYYEIPSTIYGIMPKNFGRIEYTNINENNYNPFTVLSAGETTTADDHKSIAIVREIATNTFRIGNLDDAGNIRNVNLSFDVSSLKHTKQSTNLFNLNTPDGEILTNYEINANSLFSGVFDTSPATFTAGFSQTDISIFWVLSDFTNDTNINADLYVLRDVSKSGMISLVNDASTYRPNIFYDCESSGCLQLTDISINTPYKYFMNFHKNGWERRSEIKYIATSIVPTMSITPSYVLCVSGAYPTADTSISFAVTSNVLWDVSLYPNPSTFMTFICTSVGTGNYDGSIHVNLTENTGAGRDGCINLLYLGKNYDYSIIHQIGAVVDVSVYVMADSTIDYSDYPNAILGKTRLLKLYIAGLPSNTYIDVSVTGYGFVRNTDIGSGKNLDYLVSISIPSGVGTGSDLGSLAPGGQTSPNLYQRRSNITYADASGMIITTHVQATMDPAGPPATAEVDSILSFVRITYVSGTPIMPHYGNTEDILPGNL